MIKRSQLLLSTIGEDAPEAARRFGLALELAQYCTAINLEDDAFIRASLEACRAAAPCRVLHAPIADLCPAAIDPLVRAATETRYRQAIAKARALGIRKLVVHAGYLPRTHFAAWFTAASVAFWRAFLPEVPADMVLCLENVMEPEPELLLDIVAALDDPRLRLCLDVGHANTDMSACPLAHWLSACAPYLAHLHLHNNRGAADLHAPLFEGTVDYPGVFDSLARLAPAASCTLELRRCAESVEWLEKNDLIEG